MLKKDLLTKVFYTLFVLCRHPTSCCSAAEIMSVLFFHTMHYTIEEPRHPNNDRFVLSKGHAAPILYAAWAEAGLFPASELLELRKLTSDLEGHPTPVRIFTLKIIIQLLVIKENSICFLI